jgi:hypothetical protein
LGTEIFWGKVLTSTFLKIWAIIKRLSLVLRQSILNPLDFSIILAYRPPKSNQLFRLQRYNGKSHEHTNLSKGKHFMIFTFTRQQKSIRRLAPEKTPLLNQRTDLLIFSKPLYVCSKIVVLRCLLIHKADYLRRYER